MTNAFLNGFLRDSNGSLVIVDEGSSIAPVAEEQGFARDSTGALVTTGVSGSGGPTSAALVTFDPTGLTNTASIDVQDAMADFDTAIDNAVNSIPDVTTITTQANTSQGVLHQLTDGTGAWPANPEDGRDYVWKGSGQFIGVWAAGTHQPGDGVYIVGGGNAGTYTAKPGSSFTDSSFTSTQWNKVPMNTWDELQLA